MDWKLVSLVGLGGALGAIARYLVSGWTTRTDFPTGTLVVNVLGCFLIGVLLFGGAAGGWLAPQARVFLAIGVLGGFTTMSSFTYETVALVEDAEFLRAFANVGVTLAACLAGTWAGRLVGISIGSGGA